MRGVGSEEDLGGGALHLHQVRDAGEPQEIVGVLDREVGLKSAEQSAGGVVGPGGEALQLGEFGVEVEAVAARFPRGLVEGGEGCGDRGEELAADAGVDGVPVHLEPLGGHGGEAGELVGAQVGEDRPHPSLAGRSVGGPVSRTMRLKAVRKSGSAIAGSTPRGGALVSVRGCWGGAHGLFHDALGVLCLLHEGVERWELGVAFDEDGGGTGA